MPPALETAAARGPPDVRAMPASMMGYLMPRSLHSGVFRGGGGAMVTADMCTRHKAEGLTYSLFPDIRCMNKGNARPVCITCGEAVVELMAGNRGSMTRISAGA